uniref:Uncharacterized protein n=1 Tax=Dromaius novaehollandiae TaxID=8790 RepID=A0A8C4J5J2_DRONO
RSWALALSMGLSWVLVCVPFPPGDSFVFNGGKSVCCIKAACAAVQWSMLGGLRGREPQLGPPWTWVLGTPAAHPAPCQPPSSAHSTGCLARLWQPSGWHVGDKGCPQRSLGQGRVLPWCPSVH